jgi:hypothetical protein
LLLLAASSVARYPTMCALLMEKAALYSIPARQYRKYALNIVVAGHKYNSCGTSAAINHSSVCFAAAMVLHDHGEWGSVRSKLWKSLADRMKKTYGPENSRKALILLLQILSAVSSTGNKTFKSPSAIAEAVNVYREVTSDTSWGNFTIPSGWDNIPTRDILLDRTPYMDHPPTTEARVDLEKVVDLINEDLDGIISESAQRSSGFTIIEDLRIPDVEMDSIVLLAPVNGSICLMPYGLPSASHAKIDLLKALMEVERVLDQMVGVTDEGSLLEVCADRLLLAETSLREGTKTTVTAPLAIPLGEKVVVQMRIQNPLPVDLSLRDFRIAMNLPDAFDVNGVDMVLPATSARDFILLSNPLSLGTYNVDFAQWFLGEKIQVVQHIKKTGALLQKTLSQRAHRERAPDASLLFNIVETSPCIRVEVGQDVHNTEVLCGEVVETRIVLTNEGAAGARNIELMFSAPVCAIEILSRTSDVSSNSEEDQKRFLRFFGCSSTAVRLPVDTYLAPNSSLTLKLWVRFPDRGQQEISLLTTYQSSTSERPWSRTSLASFEVRRLKLTIILFTLSVDIV